MIGAFSYKIISQRHEVNCVVVVIGAAVGPTVTAVGVNTW